MHFRIAAALLCACVSGHAAAQSVWTTQYEAKPSSEAIGSQYLADLDEAGTAARQGDLVKGRQGFERIAGYCRGFARPGLRIVATQTVAQYDAFVEQHPSEDPTERIDMACPEAFKSLAFIDIEEKRPLGEALAHLEEAIAIAPEWPEAYTERGFVLGMLGRLPDALGSYQRAIDLSEAQDAPPSMKAIAYRGRGWVQVEQKDWDGARRSYHRSLELMPGHEQTLAELGYIDEHAPKAKANDH